MMQVSRKLIRHLISAIRQVLFSFSACFLVACLFLPGCLSTPQYLLPGGYSSTYRKALIGDSLTSNPSVSATANSPLSVDHRQARAESEKKR